jgi:DNA (cytosine-5)-methyltransferase 1
MKQAGALLDLYCGAGGAAMGYYRAGFTRIVGVDIEPQRRYPFEFVQHDAFWILEVLLRRGSICPTEDTRYWLEDFALVHASPPCQAYSVANNIHGRTDHPDLIARTRSLLIHTGLDYVIENVPGAPLQHPVQICGLTLGLNVRRHRYFESNRFLFGTNCQGHKKDYVSVFGGGGRGRTHVIGRTAKNGPITRKPTIPLQAAKDAMGIDWMIRDELSQAIPPAYTEHIGRQLLARKEVSV